MAKPSAKPGAKPGVHVNKAPSAKELRAVEKEASERFTRLGLITEILRGEGRERYDHFLDNGFPKWRGTGYYYARFRPGLGSTLVGLFIFGGGLTHYVVLILGYKRQKDFVERYIAQARKSAWGDQLPGLASIPGLEDVSTTGTNTARGFDAANSSDDEPFVEPVNRRERRAQEKEAKKKKAKDRNLKPSAANKQRQSGTSTPLEIAESGTSTPVPGPKKRVEAENGKMLIVDKEGNVFLEEKDEETEETELFLLDPNEIVRPTFKETWLYRLPAWLIDLAKERLPLNKDVASQELEKIDQDSETINVPATSNGEAKANGGEIIEGKASSGTRQRKKRGKIR